MLHLEDASACIEALKRMSILIDMIYLLSAWVSTDRC